jgi:hypothetical protein
VLEAYGRWLRGWFDADVARMRELYEVFPAWSARQGGLPPSATAP